MSGLLTQEMVDEMAERTKEIYAAIRACRAFGHTDNQIRDLIVTQYGITPGYANNLLATDYDNIPSGPMLV